MRARLLLLAVVLGMPAAAVAGSVTVQPGDNLWAIAQQHGTSVEELMRVNDLQNAALQPGDVLRLPDASEPVPAAAPPPEHVVQPGDSLWAIAQQHGVTVDELIAWNELASEALRPGDVLMLQAPAAAPAPVAVAQGAAPVRVTVHPGDSLWRIARTHGVTPAAIAAANGITESAILRPGDELVIPGVHAGDDSGGDIGGYAAPVVAVSAGDTLWEIARRYGTTVAALMTANGLDDELLSVGQELRIVGSETAARLAPPVSDAVDATSDTAPTPANDDLVAAVTARAGAEPPAAAAEAAAAPAPTALVETAAAREVATAVPAPAVAQAPTMVWPLDGQITSRYGWRPLRVGGTNMHFGLDIDGNTGDPILSATAGTVSFSGWMGGFGQLVIVENGDYEYYYAHASELLVREGQQVAPGDLIARVGATGRVTGAHLHFEVREAGAPIDPLPLLEAHAGRR